MDPAIDSDAPHTIYYNDGNNNIFSRSDDGGITWTGNYTVRSESANYRRPFLLNPQRNKSVFTAFRQLYKSFNQGDSLFSVSAIKRSGDENIQAFAVAPSDTNVIYLAYSNPCWSETTKEKMYVSRDHGVHWTDITNGLSGVKWFSISTVSVDPVDPNSVYVGFTNGSDIKIMHSINAGLSWKDVTANLPKNADVDCMLIDPKTRTLFIGTHSGVWQKNTGIDNWKKTGKGLPVVMVSDLDLRLDTRELIAGTHGCGVWKIKLPTR
jgi:hypothetical protein